MKGGKNKIKEVIFKKKKRGSERKKGNAETNLEEVKLGLLGPGLTSNNQQDKSETLEMGTKASE